MRNSKEIGHLVSFKQNFSVSNSSKLKRLQIHLFFYLSFFTWYLTAAIGYFLISGKKIEMKNLLFLIICSFILELSLASFQCWTCQSKCGCRNNPMAESCPTGNKCYTLKSLINGDSKFFSNLKFKMRQFLVVKKGCAPDCLQVNQNGKICETCDNNHCNSEQSLTPMNGYDECQAQPAESRFGIRSYQPDIGGGTVYNPNNIGSGTGYNGGQYPDSGIGNGAGYNPNIGSGTRYNPDNYPNQQQPQPGIGSGAGFGNSPNGNYYPSANVGRDPYPNAYDGNGPQIGHGARPYNAATQTFIEKSLIIVLLAKIANSYFKLL